MLAGLGFFLGYLIAAKLGLSMAVINPSASAIWIPSGIALAAFLLRGPRLWPAVALAALLINWHTTGIFWSSLLVAVGNTAEGLAAFWALKRWGRGADSFEEPEALPAFVLIALAAPMLSASMGTFTLVSAGQAAGGQAASIGLTWWLGDVAGMLLTAPLILLWARRPGLERCGELFAAMLVAGALSYMVLHPRGLPLVSVLLLPVIWTAHRLGPKQGVTVVMVVTAASALGAALGKLPWPAANANESLLLLQGFAAVLSVTALAVGAATAARERELDQQKVFFAGISHDLRTPVAAIKGAAETLLLGGLDDEENRYDFVKIMERHADRLGALADNLLRIAVVEARPPGQRGSSFVRTILEEAVSGLQPLWSAKELDVKVLRTGDVSAAASEGELLQLVQSLLDNAIKFNVQKGTIRLGAEDMGSMVRVWVEDSGMGITPEEMVTLFMPLSRSKRAQTTSGTGLGLFIARRLTEAHGGKLWAETLPAGGARFVLELPAAV
jgi:signal transduction histidine kinase